MEIPSTAIDTLQQFYELMAKTRVVRSRMVERCLCSQPVDEADTNSLRNALQALKQVPSSPGNAVLAIDADRRGTFDLNYEVAELEKDLVYVTEGEEALYRHLSKLHEGFQEHLDRLLSVVGDISFRNCISDRDGTVNNYCGRYLSSIQSVYNAVFLTLFARHCVRNAVILTSAPLERPGLVDISTAPAGTFYYAGSKGREYRDTDGKRGAYDIDPTQQSKIDELNRRIKTVLEEPANEKYGMIGSGFQQKFGQTTIARQDISHSVPQEESDAFLRKLELIVADLDPEGTAFRIEDTGLDVEIILTIGGAGGEALKDFDKGDGVRFLDGRLGLKLEKGPNLICGDTRSDVPMLTACKEQCDLTWAVFVTTDSALTSMVTDQTRQAAFVSTPDILVAALHQLALRKAAQKTKG